MEDHDYNRLESSIYLAVSRSAWTLGIGWMVWACINGYGGFEAACFTQLILLIISHLGPINFILSLHIFRIFGKISYGIYLLHMGMQYMISAAARTPHYFSDLASVIGLLYWVICNFMNIERERVEHLKTTRVSIFSSLWNISLEIKTPSISSNMSLKNNLNGNRLVLRPSTRSESPCIFQLLIFAVFSA